MGLKHRPKFLHPHFGILIQEVPTKPFRADCLLLESALVGWCPYRIPVVKYFEHQVHLA